MTDLEITGPPECHQCHRRAEAIALDKYWCRNCIDAHIQHLQGRLDMAHQMRRAALRALGIVEETARVEQERQADVS